MVFSSAYVFAQSANNSKIVFIGDSNTARYGKHMHDLLKSKSSDVQYYGLPGARPYSFKNQYKYYSGPYIAPDTELTPTTKTPLMTDIVKKHSADTYIIALGGNQISKSNRKLYTDKAYTNLTLTNLRQGQTNGKMTEAERKSVLSYLSGVKREAAWLVSQIPKGKGCMYISPPYGYKTHLKPQFFHDIIKEAVEDRCHFLDGRVTDFYGGKDGGDKIHFTINKANQLADDLFNHEKGISWFLEEESNKSNIDESIKVIEDVEQHLRIETDCSIDED
jgi:hypothetical protein